jgi:hypothetical protein
MPVLTNNKSGASRMRRHRDGRQGRVAGREVSPRATLESKETTSAMTEARRQRQGGATQDQALYTCQCGFVFSAVVSTSVGCPHCGGTQAW